MLEQYKKQVTLIGVLCILLCCLALEVFAEYRLKEKTAKELELQLSIKTASLNDYFFSIESEVKSVTTTQMMQESMLGLTKVWAQLNPVERKKLHQLFQRERTAINVKQAYIDSKANIDAKQYSIHQQENENVSNFLAPTTSSYDTSPHLRSKIRPELQSYLDYFAKFQTYGKKFINHFGYYDVFLITTGGDIVYTYKLESDYATNVVNGAYRNTGLGKAFRHAVQQKDTTLFYSDYKPYSPSNGDKSMFTAYPIALDGNVIGVMALQFSASTLNKLMDYSSEMDHTGEVYLVNHDYAMVNNARINAKESNKAYKVQNENVKQGLAGTSGFGVVRNYIGNKVFSAFSPYKNGAFNMVLLSEKSVFEVLNRARFTWAAIASMGIMIYLLICWLMHGVERKRLALYPTQ